MTTTEFDVYFNENSERNYVSLLSSIAIFIILLAFTTHFGT